METATLFDHKSTPEAFDKIPCDKCSALCDGYYILSSLTKGLWVRCKNCGNHAIAYKEGLRLPWKPSKIFIKEVGKVEADRIALELQSNRGKISSVTNLNIPGVTQQNKPALISTQTSGLDACLYSDAGTRNNGQKGKQQTIIVVCGNDGKIILEKWIGDYTNNEGEILGIIACLRDYSDGKSIEVRTDSQIAAKWASNGWTKHHEKQFQKGNLSDRHREIITLAYELYLKTGSVITWIPRENNLAGHHIEKKYSI